MDSQSTPLQHVSLPLKEYNQLYEQAYLNEQRAVLAKEHEALELAKKKMEEDLREKVSRLEEAKSRGDRDKRNAVTSQNWLLTAHSVKGFHEPGAGSHNGDVAVFNFHLDLCVFEQQWTVIPLIDGQIITDAWAVQQVREDAAPSDGMDGEPAASVPVSLSSTTLLLTQELDGGPERHVLATNAAGLHRVTFNAYVFVHSARHLHSLSLNLLHPIKAAELQLKQARAARCVVRDLSITPASQYSLQEADDHLDICMRLPVTKALEIRWRAVASDMAEREDTGLEKAVVTEEEPLQIIATHDALHSIMDGVLQSSHTLKYNVESAKEGLKSVRVHVLGTARVASVAGYGVSSWHSSPSEHGSLVEVSLRSSLISDHVIILLSTELELNSDTFQVPTVECVGVLRQTGSLGIVKLANVEVHEQESRGMVHVGVDELPEELKYQTNRPIMLAYKYLSPQSHVRLRIIKHEQVGVLEAVAECVLYEVLMSEGQSMHRLMLNLQNSTQQYLEVRGIPEDARLWSLLVNSKPAKPVRGSVGSLLIPLLMGVAGNSNEGAQAMSVEMAYLVQRESLGTSGSVDLAPPDLDIPVSRLLVEVQWPEDHDVKFTGSAKAVRQFSHSLPKPVNNDVGTSIVETGFDFNRAPAHIPKAGIDVKLPCAGRRYRFEQLLVVDGGATMTVDYLPCAEKVQSKWWLECLAGFCSTSLRQRLGL